MNQRNQFTGVNSIKFHNTISTDEDCYHYLSEIKWDTGYQCKNAVIQNTIMALDHFQDDV